MYFYIQSQVRESLSPGHQFAKFIWIDEVTRIVSHRSAIGWRPHRTYIKASRGIWVYCNTHAILTCPNPASIHTPVAHLLLHTQKEFSSRSPNRTDFKYIDQNYTSFLFPSERRLMKYLHPLCLLLPSCLCLCRSLSVAPDHNHTQEGPYNSRCEEDKDDGNANCPDSWGEDILERVVRVDKWLQISH